MLPRSSFGSLSCCWLASLVLVVWLAGCGPRATQHAAAQPRAGSGVLQAGAAKVDITPLPGVPLGGHSFEGGTGYAVWTRLWARAIYLEDEQGEPMVLVVADLWSIPAGLADAVVERVREHHGLNHIGRAQLLLSATHTHHSPANFSSSRLYNRAASNRMGFDPELFEFLVGRIAAAVAEAASARAPARLRLDSAPLPAVARNRSLAPFANNPEATLLVEHNAGLPSCPDAPRDPRVDLDPCRSIDPTLTTLRIEDLDGRPRAIAAFFAVHATSMVNATDAYNGDLFAVATAQAEAALRRAAPELADPVVALFNGAEGDVSPHWESQGRADALVLGERLGAAIIDVGLRDRGRVIDGEIESGFARTPLAEQLVDAAPHTYTAKRPLADKAILGGAEDGRTTFHRRLPEGQTVERHRRAGQGPKRPAVPPALFTLIFPRSTVPQTVPIAVLRVGPLAFVGLPGEFTTIMGMRVRQAVAASSSPGAPRPITIGLAGEYMSYFVTPEEYTQQHYEGASTMWGQYAGALLAERIGALAAAMVQRSAESQPDSVSSAPFDPGLQRSFTLRPGAHAKRALRRLDERLREQLAIAPELDELPRLELVGAAPSSSSATWPAVGVEILDADARWRPLVRDGVLVDERGVEFVMFPLEVGRHTWRWAIWWIGEVPEGAVLRLHAYGPDGGEHCSSAFEAGKLAPALAQLCVSHGEAPADPADGLGVVPMDQRNSAKRSR
jgi:neutral ceramidase